MIAVIYGISTALCWGTADFIGGSASRRVGAFGMTLSTVGGGLLLLLPVALALQEAPITSSNWLWCMCAGIFDAIGILLLYMAMTSGRLTLAAPVSALTSAALPVVFGMWTQGVPKPTIVAGLVLALTAVWMVSQNSEGSSPETKTTLPDLYLPLLSGVCLGMFLILMHNGSSHAMFWPMIAVRCGGVSTLLLLFLIFRKKTQRAGTLPLGLMALTALLDVCGNSSYIIAGQIGRMDVAAVLSSLFPGTTVFLAWLILKESISRLQLAGIMVALAAIALLTV